MAPRLTGECSNSALMHDGEGEDRFSALPESVMTNILSRIPTKEAVRTSILSKSWLMTWTCIMSLYFDDEKLGPTQVEKREKFRQFVQRVISHCGAATIENFHLACSQKYDPTTVREWISHALRHGIETLAVRYRSGRFVFPSAFFECQTLREVKLLIPCILQMPSTTTFNNLKTLCITRVALVNELVAENAGELSFVFPVLKEFVLMCCVWKNVNAIKLEAPVLSFFQMAWCRRESNHGHLGGDHQGAAENMKVNLVSSTCLKTLKWAGYFMENIALPSNPTVSEASLDHIIELKDYRKTGIRAATLLGLLKTVVQLELSVDMAEAMNRTGRFETVPMFPRLTCLKLESRFTGSTRTLMELLRKTPNLRVLEINVSSLSWKTDDHDRYEMLGTPLPVCVIMSLERIYFTFRFGSYIGLSLMKLMLKNASRLQLLHLNAPELSTIPRLDIRLQLLMAPRANKNVSVVIVP